MATRSRKWAIAAVSAGLLAGCMSAPVKQVPKPLQWPEPELLMDGGKDGRGDIAACTMDAIRQGGRGQITSKLGPSDWGSDYSHYEAVYTPTAILRQCCADIRFVQIVKVDYPGWDSPKWEIDWERSNEPNPQPRPWYPYQTPFTAGAAGTAGTQAGMSDDPGSSTGPGANLGLTIDMYFETCAVCKDGNPDALDERILGCNTWKITYDTKTDLRRLNGSTTLYRTPQGVQKDYVRSTTVKSPSNDMKTKSGFKDLMDQTM